MPFGIGHSPMLMSEKKETDGGLDRAIYSVDPFALQFKSRINLNSFVTAISNIILCTIILRISLMRHLVSRRSVDVNKNRKLSELNHK